MGLEGDPDGSRYRPGCRQGGGARSRSSQRLFRACDFRARDGAHLQQGMDLCRAREPGAGGRRLLDGADRPPADDHGPPFRPLGARALQPLPASRHHALRRPLRQCRQGHHLLLPFLAVRQRRTLQGDPARQGLSRHAAHAGRRQLQRQDGGARRVLSRLRVCEPRGRRAVAGGVARAGQDRFRRHVRPRAGGRGRGGADLLPRDPAIELEDLPGEPARRTAPGGDARIDRSRGRRGRGGDPEERRRRAAQLSLPLRLRDADQQMGCVPDHRLSPRPLHPHRLHGAAAARPRHAGLREGDGEGLWQEAHGGDPRRQYPPCAALSRPLGAVPAAEAARRAAARRRQDADRDLAFSSKRRARGDLPPRARLLQPRQLAVDDGQCRRPVELLEVPQRPRIAGRRVGELPPQRRARPRDQRRDDLGHRHLRAADAQPVQGLDPVHERGELMAKKTKPNAKSAARKSAARKSTAAATRTAAKGTKPSGPNGRDTLREVEQLLYRQAECLDGKRWQEFIELFTEDGTYWMPAAPEQTTGEGVPSIFWEDRNLMTVRAKRLAHPRAWSQKTAWGTNHVIGNVTVEKEDANVDLVVRSRFHMMEFRNDTTRHFAGSYIHHLKKTQAGHRIKLQRVDMVNAEGPYEYVLQAWV